MQMSEQRWFSIIYGAQFLFWSAFVVIGSWYPFEFVPVRLGEALNVWFYSSRKFISISDLVINFFFGIPIGSFGAFVFGLTNHLGKTDRKIRPGEELFLSYRRTFINMRLMLLILYGVCFAAAVEIGQHYFKNRIPAISDTLSQIVGVLFGIAIRNWHASIAFQLYSTVRNLSNALGNWFNYLIFYGVCFVLWSLHPWIPAISPSELKMKWTDGGIEFGFHRFWVEFCSHTPEATLSVLLSIVLAVPLGIASAAAFSISRKIFTSYVVSIAIPVLLEIGSVFIETRTASLFHLIVSVVGTITGVLAYQIYSAPDSELEKGRST